MEASTPWLSPNESTSRFHFSEPFPVAISKSGVSGYGCRPEWKRQSGKEEGSGHIMMLNPRSPQKRWALGGGGWLKHCRGPTTSFWRNRDGVTDAGFRAPPSSYEGEMSEVVVKNTRKQTKIIALSR